MKKSLLKNKQKKN